MTDCSCQRILTGVVAVLSVVTVALLAILIWRETRDVDEIEKMKLTAENLIKSYPSTFRSEKEQTTFLQKYMEGITNRTIVRNITESVRGPCAFSCFDNSTTVPGRRRRQANPRGVYHGCCVSTVKFAFPKKKTNVFGVERVLLQLQGAMQYFAEHRCQKVSGCTGCTCYRENNLHTAVVLKTHIGSVDDAEYIDDTETDFFFFDGCCKCINN
ncbi:uncharacterized protein LOC132753100 [Ruditapes philippinarum]|uniref:uncharacterized protein LOC132753100 n=1 Tax=Ruditapes philippinarum TaxID=129788 RepID=UPI00295BFC43|nr:uncharacterized protein LOC132753100 [Ruditapes philippinarum]